MMKVSTRSRYGLRLMLELALRHGTGPVLLRDIAASQEISEKYLSQIIMPLKTGALVTSFRGAHGGYALQRDPERITLREIVECLEGSLDLVDCLSTPGGCTRASSCAAQDVWCRVGKAMAGTLEKITLADLARDSRARQENAGHYSI